MEKKYDLVVIGSGVSGTSVAYPCSAAGWKVAIVDNRPFGGTCALRGCRPKKVLVGAAEIIDRWKHMRGKGLDGDARINWSDLIHFKNTFTDPTPSRLEKSFVRQGIDAYQGTASFVNRNSVRVNDNLLCANTIVLATGARPRTLQIPGERFLALSDRFFELEQLPGRIVFAGGGYVSFEFAHIAVRTGAQVTILEHSDKPLAAFDRDIVSKLIDASTAAGIDIQLSAPVEAIERKGETFMVFSGGRIFEADLVIHGAGRVPYTDDLDLAKGEVSADGRKIHVNEYFQSTSNSAVYVVGDVNAHGIPLTPVGVMEGEIVAENLLHGRTRIADFKGIPSVVFTTPRLASVGMTEDQAKKSGMPLDIHFQDSSVWESSQSLGLTHASYKLIIDKNSRQLLGAHLLGHNADEVINLFAMAIRLGLDVDQVQNMVWTYPTFSHDLTYMLQGW